MAMRAFRNGRGPVRMVSRSTLAWRGALAVVIGLIAVIWPGITLGAFVILFAVYALIAAKMPPRAARPMTIQVT